MKKKFKLGHIWYVVLIVIIPMSRIVQINNIEASKKNVSENFDVRSNSLMEILDNANEIRLEQKILSFKKHYYIKVDEVLVGEVTGEFLTFFGDTLTMTDINGYTVRKEYQIKRLGPTKGKSFNISLSRLAEIRDSNDSITGYIGEEKLKDFFNLNHKQYFYDKDTAKVGYARPNFFILSKDYKVYDNDDNILYEIDGNIFSLSSKATIVKKDNHSIDEEDVIFYTIIENAIIDSKTSGGGSKSSKSSSK